MMAIPTEADFDNEEIGDIVRRAMQGATVGL